MELNRTLIKEMLELPFSIFEKEIFPKAKHAAKEGGKNKITPVAMMGFSNICKNRCLYCGMNAECKIERYRLSPDEVINLAKKRPLKVSGVSFLFPEKTADMVLRIF